MLKRLLLSVLALAGILGVAHAVNITGTNSQNENSVLKVGYERLSITDAITAFAGGGQTSAVLLDSGYNRVTVTATNADSVKLPSCHTGASNTGPMPAGVISGNTTGLSVYVTNAGAATLGVWPQTGEQINALGINTVYSGMTTGKTAQFLCSPAGGTWYSILGG